MSDDFMKELAVLMNDLRELPGNVGKNALRTGIFRAAQVMTEKVKAAAPVSDGDPPKGMKFRVNFPQGSLRRMIKARRRRGSMTEIASGVSGTFYARFVEFGHAIKSHREKKKRKDRTVLGHVPANPFVKRTFEANKDQLVEIVKKGIIESINRQFAKRRKKLGL